MEYYLSPTVYFLQLDMDYLASYQSLNNLQKSSTAVYIFLFCILTWEFRDFESKCGGSFGPSNNKIVIILIDGISLTSTKISWHLVKVQWQISDSQKL